VCVCVCVGREVSSGLLRACSLFVQGSKGRPIIGAWSTEEGVGVKISGLLCILFKSNSDSLSYIFAIR
jgi:hypothetical protein